MLFENRDEFEQRIRKMIADPRLDNFNRWCSLCLYLNYLANLDQDSEQQDKVAALKADISDYPSFMQPAIANFSVMN